MCSLHQQRHICNMNLSWEEMTLLKKSSTHMLLEGTHCTDSCQLGNLPTISTGIKHWACCKKITSEGTLCLDWQVMITRMMMMMMMMGLPVDSGWVSKLATNTLKSRFHRRFLRRALRILTTPEQCTRGNQISPKSENRIGWTSRRRIVSAEHHLNTRCTLMTIVPVRAVFMTISKPVCSHTL